MEGITGTVEIEAVDDQPQKLTYESIVAMVLGLTGKSTHAQWVKLKPADIKKKFNKWEMHPDQAGDISDQEKERRLDVIDKVIKRVLSERKSHMDAYKKQQNAKGKGKSGGSSSGGGTKRKTAPKSTSSNLNGVGPGMNPVAKKALNQLRKSIETQEEELKKMKDLLWKIAIDN